MWNMAYGGGVALIVCWCRLLCIQSVGQVPPGGGKTPAHDTLASDVESHVSLCSKASIGVARYNLAYK